MKVLIRIALVLVLSTLPIPSASAGRGGASSTHEDLEMIVCLTKVWDGELAHADLTKCDVPRELQNCILDLHIRSVSYAPKEAILKCE